MCGIVGVANLREPKPIPEALLSDMLGAIRHRGPDGFGIYRHDWVGLGNARLSIIDLSGGDQPIGNEDDSLWMVFNGEIFNYVELRPELERLGHHFHTHSDTEVILHMYEELGPGCLNRFNGQFAIALWDERQRSLFLARDRVGVRPVFYTLAGDQLVFASEIKAILQHPAVQAEIDRQALTEIFTFWSPQPPHSIFKNIFELPPGHYLLLKNGQIEIRPYWQPAFVPDEPGRSPESYLEELESLLIDSTQIRLRADVPVGAYLSGGLDSSLTTALIRSYNSNRLDTFSISFSDPHFDESSFQGQMAEELGTDHHEVHCDYRDIAEAFPDVIWHTETPILRTAPTPMYLLSRLVREHNFKVVLTGEGADEFMAGYDIFKEMKIRRFWAENPDSKLRSRLLFRLYPDINRHGRQRGLFGGLFQARFARHRFTLLLAPHPLDEHRADVALSGRRWRGQTGAQPGLARRLFQLARPQPGPVPGSGHLPLALSAFLARRPHGHGPLRRRTLPLPGLPRDGIRQPAAAQPEDARADRKVAAQAPGPQVPARTHLAAGQTPLPRAHSPQLLRPPAARLRHRAAFRGFAASHGIL